MKKISLKNDYVKIVDSNNVYSFGGNQAWFSKNKKANVKGQGCGIISAIDASLYLSNQRIIDQETYKALAKSFLSLNVFSKIFMAEFLPGTAIGILPHQICKYIKKYAGSNLANIKNNVVDRSAHFYNSNKLTRGGRYYAHWNGLHGHYDMLNKMKKMIENDLPVIWSLYKMGSAFPLYVYDTDNHQYKQVASTNSHYVNAVSIIEDPLEINGHHVMIEISSWGKKFFIDYEEYLKIIDNSFLSALCSNIVLIVREQ